MRKSLILLAVLMFFGTGGYFAFQAWSNSNPPEPAVRVGEQEVTVIRGSYCWGGLFSSVCADTAAPPELVKQQEPIVVPPGAAVQITFSEKPQAGSVHVNRWLASGDVEEVPFDGSRLVVPEEKGTYVYSVSARWERGDAGYAFTVAVR